MSQKKKEHDFLVGDVIKNKKYPQEVALVIEVEANLIKVSHPYGWDWYTPSDCELIEREFDF